MTPQDVIALALATVDVDAAASAAPQLGFQPAPLDEVLGARGVFAALGSGRTLLLLEPATEGRLAAFLARHGEGLAALYVRRTGPVGSTGPALGRPKATALGRPGRLVGGGRIGDAVIVLVA